MLCSLSKQVAKEPVASTKSGVVYEKSLVEKYIDVNGTCPVTGEPLTRADLLSLRSEAAAATPRPVRASSIPGMLAAFQSEWDALMLESFQMRSEVQTLRKELSHALYQHDAACRVIARLLKERDEARSALADPSRVIAAVSNSGGASAAAAAPDGAGGAEAMDVDEAQTEGSGADVVQRMQRVSAELASGRKARRKALQASLTPVEQVARFRVDATHKPVRSVVHAVAVHPGAPSRAFLASQDKTARVLNLESGKVAATLSGHTKPVRHVSVATPTCVLTGSDDKTVRVWRAQDADSSYAGEAIWKLDSEVAGISVHPSSDLVAAAARNASWSLFDMRRDGKDPVFSCEAQEDQSALVCGAFHPDGLVFLTGSADGTLRAWDASTKAQVFQARQHQGQVTSVAASENGYHVVTCGSDDYVRLWDLRKISVPQAEVCVEAVSLDEGAGLASVAFDMSGSYLVVSGANGISVRRGKSLASVVTLNEHSKPVSDAAFLPDAAGLVSTSLDKTVKVWRAASDSA